MKATPVEEILHFYRKQKDLASDQRACVFRTTSHGIRLGCAYRLRLGPWVRTRAVPIPRTPRSQVCTCTVHDRRTVALVEVADRAVP